MEKQEAQGPVSGGATQPLEFSFRKDPERIKRGFPGYAAVMHGLQHLQELNYEEVCQLAELFEAFKAFYQRRMMIFYAPRGIWVQETKSIDERKKALTLQKFPQAQRYYDACTALTMTDEEEVNGYMLYNRPATGAPVLYKTGPKAVAATVAPVADNVMDFQTFQQTWATWQESDMTEQEFRDWFNCHACSDWAKQDRDGECYGGFWRAEEGTYERENAYQLSHDDNLNGLCELPYPRRVIKLTVEWGCGNRLESVRYSNFLCEWIKRKAALLEDQ